MFKNRIRKSAHHVRGRFSGVVRLLLRDEAISGKFLLLAALVAIVAVNSPWAHTYQTFWEHDLTISIGSLVIAADLRHWINDGLMAIFFLVISLEIKRELVRGELRKFRAAILPVVAAIGGMAAPIAIYTFMNNGFEGIHGWGIPMTTDTAFAIGLLALLGRRVPTALKIFLLTTMVVDDVAAIAAIAVFYTSSLNLLPLVIAGGIMVVILLLHWLRFLSMRSFIILGLVLWVAIYLSGVHASITGVILGLFAPITIRHRAKKPSIAERLESSLIPFSTLIVIPLFAFANAGVLLDWNIFNQEPMLRIGAGVFLGLALGKVAGIVTAVWLAKILRLVRLPKGTTMHHITGAALLAGVGFTLSIFIAELAFGTSRELINAAKIGIFAASIFSAIAGLLYLSIVPRRRRT